MFKSWSEIRGCYSEPHRNFFRPLPLSQNKTVRTPERKKKASKALVRGLTKTVQRQTALNPEHRNLFISVLARNLPDIKEKKQITDNRVEWDGLTYDVI